MGAAFLPLALIAGAGASVAGGIMRSDEASREEQEQEQSIKLQESRAKAQSAAQQIDRAKQEDNVLAQQKAMAAAQGMSESSGSFTASVLGQASNFEQDEKLNNLSLTMSVDNMEASINQLREREEAEQMQNFFNIGTTIAGAGLDMAGLEEGGKGFSSADDSLTRDYYQKNIAKYNMDSGGYV